MIDKTGGDPLSTIRPRKPDLWALIEPSVLIHDFISGGRHPWLGEVRKIWDDVLERSWEHISPYVKTIDEKEWQERLNELRIIGLIDDRLWYKALTAVSSKNNEDIREGAEECSPLLRLDFFGRGEISRPSSNYFKMCSEEQIGDSCIIIPHEAVQILKQTVLTPSSAGDDFVFYHVSEACDSDSDGLDQLTKEYAVEEVAPIDNDWRVKRPIIWMRFGKDYGPFEWVDFYLDKSDNLQLSNLNVRIVIPQSLFLSIPYIYRTRDLFFSPVYIDDAYASDDNSIVEWNGVYARDFRTILDDIGEPIPKNIMDGAGIFLHIGHVYDKYLSILRLTQKDPLSYIPSITNRGDHPIEYALKATLSHEIGHHLFQIPFFFSFNRKFVSEGYAQWFSNLYCMATMRASATTKGYPNNQPFVPYSDLSAFILYYSYCQDRIYSSYRFMNIFRMDEEFRDASDTAFRGDTGGILKSWDNVLCTGLIEKINASEPRLHAIQYDHSAVRGFLTAINYHVHIPELFDQSCNLFINKDIRKHVPPDVLFILYNDGYDPSKSVPIEERTDNEIMAAFRQASSRHGWCKRDEILERVADHLGYPHCVTPIKDILRSRLRAAVRRRIIETKGNQVRIGTPTMADYTTDELVDVIRHRMRKGRRYDLDDIAHKVAEYLGFRRLHPSVRKPIENAMKNGKKRRFLYLDGSWIVRKK